jgi:hypothetical protein
MAAVTDASPVPRRVRPPGWLDLRLALGLVLVLCSVGLGARILAHADRSVTAVAMATDVAAGTVLSADEVRVVHVRLPATARGQYPGSPHVVVGRQAAHGLRRGELLTQAALEEPTEATTLAIPLRAGDAPRISAGQRIALWAWDKACGLRLVVSDVAVQAVHDDNGGFAGGGGGQQVVVQVAPALAQDVVAVLASDDSPAIRAGIVTGPSRPDPPNVPSGACPGS